LKERCRDELLKDLSLSFFLYINKMRIPPRYCAMSSGTTARKRKQEAQAADQVLKVLLPPVGKKVHVQPKQIAAKDCDVKVVASEVAKMRNSVADCVKATRTLIKFVTLNASGSGEGDGVYVTVPSFVDDPKEPVKQVFTGSGTLGGNPEVRKIRGIGSIPMMGSREDVASVAPPVKARKLLPISPHNQRSFLEKQAAAKTIAIFFKRGLVLASKPKPSIFERIVRFLYRVLGMPRM